MQTARFLITKWLVSLLCLLVSITVVAQWDQYAIQHFTTTEGLPDNAIRCLAKDNYGFLWIGTQSGLARFDGKKFKTYLSNPFDSTTISGNTIDFIYCDINGNLWISCHKSGLNKFDFKKQTFKRYYHSTEKKGSTPNNVPGFIIEDNQNRLWIGFFGQGIAQYIPELDSFETIKFEANTKPYSFNESTAAIKDDQGNIWIATRVGLVKFNPNTKEYKKFQHRGIQNHMPYNLFTSIDWNKEKKQIALGTWGRGITIYTPETNSWKTYLLNNTLGESNNRIHQVKFSSANNLLFTAYDQGLGHLNLSKDKLEFIDRNNNKLPRDFSNISSGTALFSINNSLYIGSKNGLFQLNKLSKAIHTIDASSIQHPNNQDASVLSSFVIEKDWEMIYGASFYRNGIIAFSKNNGKPTKVYYLENPNENLNIYKLLRNPYKNNEILISSSKGLLKFQPGIDSTIKFYDFKSDSLNQLLQGRYMSTMQFDSKGSLVMSFRDYVMEWDEQRLVMVDLLPEIKNPDINSYQFFKINSDSKNNLWLINYQYELVHYLREKNYDWQFRMKEHLKNIHPKMVMDICVLSPEKLWLAINNTGVISYNTKTQETEYFGVKQGLGHSIVKSMVSDKKGRLWILTYQGISCLIPDKKTIQNFNSNDGIRLIDQEAIEYSNTGHIIASGMNNAYFFNPDSLLSEISIPDLSLYLDEIKAFTTSSFIPLPSDSNEFITLNHQNNYLGFGFTLPFISGNNDFFYYSFLEGVDKDWLSLGKEGSVSYSNIPPGKYTVRLGAKNSLGEWCAKPILIHINIKPPFYRTYWFYTLIALMILVIILITLNYRVRFVKNREREKRIFQKQINELENQALRSQMNPHFIFNSLNSINSYIIKNKPDEASEYVSKFARLIRLILDNSKESTVTLGNEIAALKLYIEIENKRFSNKFEWELYMDENINLNHTFIPPMILQPFVENAIWHGLMHKKENGKLSIQIHQMNNTIQCDITDDGIGRTAAGILKSKTSLQNKSHGLTLTKERIENFNKDSSISNSVKVIDLFYENGDACGTKVILTLALKTNQL